MTTDHRPDMPQRAERRSSTPLAALGLLTSMSFAAISIYLLGRRDRTRRTQEPATRIRSSRSTTGRVMLAGIEILPILLPLLLEQRHKEQPAAVVEPPKPRTARRIGAYAWPILLCLALGGLAGWLQRPALSEWYPTLLKSAGTPPSWMFPVAWGIIYISMGISAGRIVTTAEGPRREVLTIWGIQLGVNFLWSMLFFVARSPLLGMIDIVVLDALTILYIVRSYPLRRDAAWLFVPYLAWLFYATYLNAWILFANGPGI